MYLAAHYVIYLHQDYVYIYMYCLCHDYGLKLGQSKDIAGELL